MKKISVTPFWWKYLMPIPQIVIYYVFIFLIFDKYGGPSLILLIFFGICGVGEFYLNKLLTWDLMDVVYDNGDELIFKKGNKEQCIRLGDIINIGYSMGKQPERIEIFIRTEGVFGNKLAFIPPRRFPYKRNPMVMDLIERVDRARNNKGDS